jgi:hypothetical protein
MARGQLLLNHKKVILAIAAVLLIPVSVLAAVRLTGEYREEAESWELRGVSEDGRTLTILYTTPPSCESLDRIEKSETTSRVALRLVIRRRLDCASEDVAVPHTTKVELTRPLANRELVDARTGDAPKL